MGILLKKFGGWILGVLSFVGMLATIWFTSKKVGKSEAKADAAEQKAVEEIAEAQGAAARQVEVVQNANEVAKENSTLSDAAVSDKLRDNWTRD